MRTFSRGHGKPVVIKLQTIHLLTSLFIYILLFYLIVKLKKVLFNIYYIHIDMETEIARKSCTCRKCY